MLDIRVASGKPLKRKYLVFVGDVFLRDTDFFRRGKAEGGRHSAFRARNSNGKSSRRLPMNTNQRGYARLFNYKPSFTGVSDFPRRLPSIFATTAE